MTTATNSHKAWTNKKGGGALQKEKSGDRGHKGSAETEGKA